MVLGIGGVRALRALGIATDVYHFNEGHAVLAAFELIREQREAGLSLEEAKEVVRRQIVFTTHTPIKEGNESHPHELLQYLGAGLGLTIGELHAIGGTPFNMTVAALHLCRAANGVARLHSETAEKMWQHVETRPPIIGITNGIDRKTWVDRRITEPVVRDDDKLWQTHCEIKGELIDFIEQRTGQRLDQNKLLIGFARRAAPYKRSNLIFQSDPAVLAALKDGRFQIVFSGKAHPLDDAGKGIVEDIARRGQELPDSVVFLEDYDMEIGAMLTRGCDVWLNNPRRPLEACGTSGMKAAMNGVLNCSILDGWWPEACRHGENGWAIGDEKVFDNPEEQDERDRKFLAGVILDEVLPLYENDRPRWVTMMRSSIESTRERFSATTMLKHYFDKMYRV